MKARLARLAGVGITAALALVFVLRAPALILWLPPCPLHRLTGLYCPGCGGTRATVALLHGDLAAALAMNPLLFLVGPLLAWLLFAALFPAQAPHPALPTWLQWSAVSLVIAFGLLRNLPVYPFLLLAPH